MNPTNVRVDPRLFLAGGGERSNACSVDFLTFLVFLSFLHTSTSRYTLYPPPGPPLQLNEAHFVLLLSADINSLRHHQWFYFAVKDLQPGVDYQFDIVNMEKPGSQFQHGMQPVVCCPDQRRGWSRCGHHIGYYCNGILKATAGGTSSSVGSGLSAVSAANTGHSTSSSTATKASSAAGTTAAKASRRSSSELGSDRNGPGGSTASGGSSSVGRKSTTSKVSSAATGATVGSDTEDSAGSTSINVYYTLTFRHRFELAPAQHFLAYHYPYSYSDLLVELNRLCREHGRQQFLCRHELCPTLAGNACTLLTITSWSAEDLAAMPMSARRYIVLTARVHPGETNSSWVMQGVRIQGKEEEEGRGGGWKRVRLR